MSQYPDSLKKNAQAQEAHQPLMKEGKLRVVRSWKALPALLLLALFLLLGQGVTHAATSSSAVAAHPHSPTLTCNYRTYSLASSLRLVRSDGYVVDLLASNMDGQDTVRISNNGVYMGEYFLPTTDSSEIVIYVGSNGGELVNACTSINDPIERRAIPGDSPSQDSVHE